MNVGDLRAALEGVPDDVPVMIDDAEPVAGAEHVRGYGGTVLMLWSESLREDEEG